MVKLQSFGHLMRRADSLEKTLMLGKTEGGRRGRQRRWLDGITNIYGHEFEQTLGDSGGQRTLAAVHGVTMSQTEQTATAKCQGEPELLYKCFFCHRHNNSPWRNSGYLCLQIN